MVRLPLEQSDLCLNCSNKSVEIFRINKVTAQTKKSYVCFRFQSEKIR